MPTVLEYNSKDIDEPFHWVGVRMSIGVAVVIGYMIHLAFLALGFVPQLNKDGKICKDTLKSIQKKMFMFGLAGLLSITPLQGSTWNSIWVWFTLISLVLVHATVLPQFRVEEKQNLKNILFIVYYVCIFMWLTGCIMAFFHTNNQDP